MTLMHVAVPLAFFTQLVMLGFLLADQWQHRDRYRSDPLPTAVGFAAGLACFGASILVTGEVWLKSWT